jgi:hypothetical protein
MDMKYLGVAVLGTAVLGVAVLGIAVLQPGTAHSAQPWVAPLFSKGASHNVQWQPDARWPTQDGITLVRHLAWPCSGPACCNSGPHIQPSLGSRRSNRKVHHTACSGKPDARRPTHARWDHLGAALGVAVLGTAVLGVAVLGIAVLQPGTAHSAQPWVAPLFSKGASHSVQWQARCTMAHARWDHLGAALGVAVLGIAVLQPGTAHSVQPWVAPL